MGSENGNYVEADSRTKLFRFHWFISIEDVIGFFNDNEYWKGHCQKIMDQEIHESKCKRHILALTTRDLGLFSDLRGDTNICFLRAKLFRFHRFTDLVKQKIYSYLKKI